MRLVGGDKRSATGARIGSQWPTTDARPNISCTEGFGEARDWHGRGKGEAWEARLPTTCERVHHSLTHAFAHANATVRIDSVPVQFPGREQV